jgi:hypothetical protein
VENLERKIVFAIHPANDWWSSWDFWNFSNFVSQKLASRGANERKKEKTFPDLP